MVLNTSSTILGLMRSQKQCSLTSTADRKPVLIPNLRKVKQRPNYWRKSSLSKLDAACSTSAVCTHRTENPFVVEPPPPPGPDAFQPSTARSHRPHTPPLRSRVSERLGLSLTLSLSLSLQGLSGRNEDYVEELLLFHLRLY